MKSIKGFSIAFQSDHKKVIVEQWKIESEDLKWALSADVKDFCESSADKRDLEFSKEVTELINNSWQDFLEKLRPEEKSRIQEGYQLKKQKSG